MQDLTHDLTQLSTMKSLWDVMGYPKLAGRHEAGAYYYDVMLKNGDGGWSRLQRLHQRGRALSLLATLPAGSYVAMFHSQTHRLVGEQGRADERVLNVLLQILQELEDCERELAPLVSWREEQMWKPERSVELCAIQNRLFVEVMARLEQLKSQGRVLAAACVLPPEAVMW